MRLLLGDCVEVMRELEEASVDAIVCDPPYGLEFMGKEWDRLGADLRQPNDPTFHRSGVGPFDRAKVRHGYDTPIHEMQAWHLDWATEALRVLKPGGHLLAFGGTRTYHRLACAVEDAGFEIRDCIAWMYGSGFPKSHDVSKAIDKAAGAEREVVGTNPNVERSWRSSSVSYEVNSGSADITTPATEAARQWNGWGTALKPGFEPIVVARKPLVGTVAETVQRYGTGALNVDGCRVEAEPYSYPNGPKGNVDPTSYNFGRIETPVDSHPLGRWPANVVLDEAAAGMLDAQSGETVSRIGAPRGAAPGEGWGMTATGSEYGDFGGASRFFYTAKASRAERNAGLEGFEERAVFKGNLPDNPRCEACGRQRIGALGAEPCGCAEPDWAANQDREVRNHHPTVKPIALMRWLVRLVTPPGGTVLDPFCGSGTTGIAAELEGFTFIGIEREPEYHAIAEARMAWWAEHGEQALLAMYEAEQRKERETMGQLALEIELSA